MTGAEIPLIIAAVGTGTQVYGSISSANNQAEAQRRDAALKNEQANEILAREAINRTAIDKQTVLDQGAYAAAFAASGREGGGIGGQIDIFNSAQEIISNARREAKYKSDALRQGADIQASLASDIVSSSYYTGAGTLLTTGARIGYMKAGSDKGGP